MCVCVQPLKFYTATNLLSVSPRKWQSLCSIRRSLIVIRSLRRIRSLIHWRKEFSSWPGYDIRVSSQYSTHWRSPGDNLLWHRLCFKTYWAVYMGSILSSLDKYEYDAQKCLLSRSAHYFLNKVLSSLHFIFNPLFFDLWNKTDMKPQKQII